MSKKVFLIIGASINAGLMLFFAFYLLSLPYVHGDDMLLIEYGAKIKNIVFGFENKPPKKDFMFVNVAYDKQLIDKLDTNGFSMGKQAIVDRKKLARFFEVLAKKPKNQKFILCDIHFADSASVNTCEGDSISNDFKLAKALKTLPNILLSYHLNEEGMPEYPIFRDIPRGLSDYATPDGFFLKFKLLQNDSVKTTPLLMYEYLHKQKLQKTGFFYQMGKNKIFNTFIVNLRIRNYDVFHTKEPYKIDNLENILSGAMSEADILEYVKDRIIVVGDFSLYDNHETIYGETAGPLLLLNTYLALERGDNILSLSLVLCLFVGFWWASYLAFRPSIQIINTQAASYYQRLKSFLSYVLVLAFTSMLCYFIFEISLSILYLSVYLFCLRYILLLLMRSIRRRSNA